ncbi:hypothetical protein CTEN210_04121 [Chaetoceros tenuissimus]|uniref:Uncharacterized protein n=1 Tax=Chaetoceros tenuissimus TaxID=426638 RepID=A0AAD3CMI4_9STRA|nr:hypothetical protein CTEN210_04121 [Chaetoceros tenuissimus]
MSTNKRLRVSHTSGNEVAPASISDLPNDLLKHCFSFIPGSYITIAPVSRHFFTNYCTVGIDDSIAVLSADSLLKIGRNKRTTADAVSDDIKLTEYAFINNAPEDFMIKVCQSAAMKGLTDILECAKIFGVDLIKVRMEENLIFKLVEEGNLEMIQYFDRSSKLFEKKVCDERIFIFHLARDSDHLQIMKWIFQEKMHLFEDSDEKNHIRATIEAYEHVLEGITAPEVTYELYEMATMKGNIEALEYCHRSNYQFDFDETILCDISMQNKDKEQALVTLKWLRRHGYLWYESLCSAAVSNDNIEALKWVRSEGCSWDIYTLRAAAQRGNIAMIEYCLQNECPTDDWAYASAMCNKNENIVLECLKLLRKYSCPWSVHTCTMAIISGHFEALRWAKRNGCPWTEDVFCNLVKRGNISIIEEFLQDEPRHDTNRIFEEALRNESLNDSQIIEKLKLLHKYGYEWNANTTQEAAKQGRLSVLQWLRYIGCELDVESCIAAVRSHKNTDVLKYLQGIAN